MSYAGSNSWESIGLYLSGSTAPSGNVSGLPELLVTDGVGNTRRFPFKSKKALLKIKETIKQAKANAVANGSVFTF
jgi:hypothetical protein